MQIKGKLINRTINHMQCLGANNAAMPETASAFLDFQVDGQKENISIVTSNVEEAQGLSVGGEYTLSIS